MEKARRFEDLWIWQQARQIVRDVYADFGDSNGVRDFGFRDQIQRAAVSVMNNISEGFERHSDREHARFLEIARGSCAEVRSMYYVAEDLAYVSPVTAESRRSTLRKLIAGIASLRKSLQGVEESKSEKSASPC